MKELNPNWLAHQFNSLEEELERNAANAERFRMIRFHVASLWNEIISSRRHITAMQKMCLSELVLDIPLCAVCKKPLKEQASSDGSYVMGCGEAKGPNRSTDFPVSQFKDAHYSDSIMVFKSREAAENHALRASLRKFKDALEGPW